MKLTMTRRIYSEQPQNWQGQHLLKCTHSLNSDSKIHYLRPLQNPSTQQPKPKPRLPAVFCSQFPFFLPGYPIIRHPGRLLGGNRHTQPVSCFQQVQTHRLQMALRTHFNQPEIGCPGIAEFTVQRPEALFDHITGLRQISVALRLCFRQRTVAVGFAHNAVLQPMLFQMLPVFLTVIAFVGIDGRTFGYIFQQR